MDPALTLGRYLRQLRFEADFSLLNLADLSGLSYTHLSRIENDSAVPNPETLAKLAEVLHGDIVTMLELADNLPKSILDRLVARSQRGEQAALRRGKPLTADSARFTLAAVDDSLVRADLSAEETQRLLDAVEKLIHLPLRQRRLILDLISSYFSEGDDPTG